MRIEQILSQMRSFFTAIYVCEHCGETYEGIGYTDDLFRQKVIPKMVCDGCGKTAPENYRPLAH